MLYVAYLEPDCHSVIGAAESRKIQIDTYFPQNSLGTTNDLRSLTLDVIEFNNDRAW